MRLIDVLLIGLLHIGLSVCNNAPPTCSLSLAVNLSEETNNTFNLRNAPTPNSFRRYLRERTEVVYDTNPRNFVDYLQFSAATHDFSILKIDRESCESLSACRCHPSGSPCTATLTVSVLQDYKLQCTLTVTFTIVDINDNSPVWTDSHTLELHFNENEPPGTVNPTLIAASDADAPGSNSQLTYRLVPASSDFAIENRNGLVQLKTSRMLDREARSNYSFRLEAVDHGSPPRTGTVALTVLVDDVNDHSPVFSNTLYNVSVDETLEIGESVVQVRATDNDSGSRLSYHVVDAGSTFRVNDDGVVQLAEKLDYESRQAGQPFYRFTVFAYDNGAPPRSSSALVVVQVRDVNDHPPTIRAPHDVNVYEHLPRGSYASRIAVDDVDFGPVRCWLPSDASLDDVASNRFFDLKEDAAAGNNAGMHRAYTLLTAAELDREQSSQHVVHVVCADLNGQSNALSTTATITVHVSDVNDNAPMFDSKSLSFSVAETADMAGDPSSGSSTFRESNERQIGFVSASDADDGANAQITYELLPGGDSQCFTIDRHSGQISVHCHLDREMRDTLSLQVLASDSGLPPRNSTATIRINITDVNDCVPTFTSHRIEFNVEESDSYTRIGSLLGYVRDCDQGRNAQLSFKLNHAEQSEEAKRFAINVQGELYTLSALDREIHPNYTLNMLVYDNGEQPLSSSASIVVRISDINDNSPVFERPTQTSFNVSCQERTGYVITRLLAIDRDAEENGTVRYAIVSGNSRSLFTVNATSGELLVANSLINANDNYKLKIAAFDHGRSPRNSSIEVNISVDSVSPVSGSHRQAPEDSVESEAATNFRQYSLSDVAYETRDTPERNPYERANEIVIISLAAIFIVLLFITVALIIWLRRKDSLLVSNAKRARKSTSSKQHESKPLSDKGRSELGLDDEKSAVSVRPLCTHHAHLVPSNGYQSIDLGEKAIDEDAQSDCNDQNDDCEEQEHASGYESPDSCEVDDGSRSRDANNLPGSIRHVATLPFSSEALHQHSRSFSGLGHHLVPLHPHMHSNVLDPSQLPFSVANATQAANSLQSMQIAHAHEPFSLIRCEPPLKYPATVTLPPHAYNDYNPLGVAHGSVAADRVLHLATPMHQATMLSNKRMLAYPACPTHRRPMHPHAASAGGKNSHLYYEINGTNVTSDCSESVCAYMSNAVDSNANNVGLNSLPRPAAPAPLAHQSLGMTERPPTFCDAGLLEQSSKKVGPLYGEASYV